MKYCKQPLVVFLAITLSFLTSATLAVHSASAQNQSTALERGYRTGYSDGYNAGTRDMANKAPRDYKTDEDYQRADRSFNEAWGTIEEYRDGYQQGFEAGYMAGYDRRPFDSSAPAGLKTRGVVDTDTTAPTTNTTVPTTNTTVPTTNNSTQTDPADTSAQTPAGSATSGAVFIPRDTLLLVELQTGISTDISQRNDRFQARVVEPREFAGAIVEGRVTQVKRAGKVKGTARLQLTFESIHMPDGRGTGFNAEVVEIVNAGHRDDVGTVDDEGGVSGKSSTKDDVTRVGAGAGIGAVIGAILGGGKGAAIGAVIGGGAGAGSVLTKRGDDVRLTQGQQLRIRSNTETRIQQGY
jgi:hypothetical protein